MQVDPQDSGHVNLRMIGDPATGYRHGLCWAMGTVDATAVLPPDGVREMSRK